MEIAKDTFIKQAEKIPDCYEDFASITWLAAKQRGHIEEVYNFMVEHPDATTDDVTLYSWDIAGIKY